MALKKTWSEIITECLHNSANGYYVTLTDNDFSRNKEM